MGQKIDVSKFDHFVFSNAMHTLHDSMSPHYKTGNYIEYIKSICLGRLFSDCNFLFSMRNRTIPTCYKFPESGRDYTYQSFKKLRLTEKIPFFNISYSKFYEMLTPDFERVVSILSEHCNRWKALVKQFKAVEIIEKLQSIYKMNKNILGGDSRIYELYFIYENQYLHQQFDRFLSAKDFLEWWDKEAVKILTPEGEE